MDSAAIRNYLPSVGFWRPSRRSMIRYDAPWRVSGFGWPVDNQS